jgi:hypothetical protein
VVEWRLEHQRNSLPADERVATARSSEEHWGCDSKVETEEQTEFLRFSLPHLGDVLGEIDNGSELVGIMIENTLRFRVICFGNNRAGIEV